MRHAAFALLLAAACAGPNPIPSGDKPAWVSTPNGDVRFPPDRYLAAVGSVPVGQKLAPDLLASVDAAAREAVAGGVKSGIAAEVTSFTNSQAQRRSAADKLTADQRLAEVLAGFDLASAIQIQGRWRSGDTAYAWAVFDKQKEQEAQAAKASEHEKLAKDLLAQGDAAAAQTPADALRSYARARTEAAAAQGGFLLARGLGGKAELTGTMAEAEGKVGALLEELTLTVAEGDRQRAVESKPLPQPIVFTAWLKGKKAVGLPMAVTVAGGRANNVSVGPDGKGEVRVDDIGKFAKREQQIQIAVDWPGLLGVPADRVPAWISAQPNAGVTAVALKKGIETTRVLVLIYEKIDGGFPVTQPPLAAVLASSLQKAGFDVQNGQALLDKFGAERISRMTDAQLREAAKRVADVVVIGSAVSRYASNYGTTTVFHRAKADIRALEVQSGQVVFQAPADEVKSKRPGEPNTAGRSALQALGEALAPPLQAALVKAAME